MSIVIGIIVVPFLYAILQKALPNTPIMKKVHSYVHLLMISALLAVGIGSFSSRPANISELIKVQTLELQEIQAGSTNLVSQNFKQLVYDTLEELEPDLKISFVETNITALKDNIIIHASSELSIRRQERLIKDMAEKFQISTEAIVLICPQPVQN